MPALEQLTIVGASLAGMQAAQTARRSGFEGELVIIGDEPHYPYDRPPLSKQYLAGSWDEAKLRLRAASDPDELGVEWRLGVGAASLDLHGRRVNLSDGSAVPFDGLVIACGARPRSIPGTDLDGVHLLRSLDQARDLKAALEAGPDRVTVIGAGFIGAEVAATAREMGLEVTLIEGAKAPMARVLDHAAGMAIAELHAGHGVDVRLGVGVDSVVSETGDGAVSGLVLSDGSTLQTSLVVIGIGVSPNTEWLEDSGISIDNGVVCDAQCIAAPGVGAAGDVARWPNQRFGGELTRVEQWENAIDQGSYVAKRLLAGDVGAESMEPFAPVPWFWSDQYDRKIQLAGVPGSSAEVVHGSFADQKFVQLYCDDAGVFVGALAWNRPRHAIQARQLLEQGASIEQAREKLGD